MRLVVDIVAGIPIPVTYIGIITERDDITDFGWFISVGPLYVGNCNHICVCNCMCAVQNPITAQITKSAGQALLSPLELNKGQGKLHTCLGFGRELPH